MQKPIFLIAISFLLFSACLKNKKESPIVKAVDLQSFFEADNGPIVEKTLEELTFWQNKYQQDKNQYPYLLKIAEMNDRLFKLTGAENYLLQSNAVLTTIYEELGVQNAGVLRALAHNHMNLHQFDKALVLAEKAKALKEDEAVTDLLLYDLYDETGNSDKAASMLQNYPDKNSFSYRVRYSKWLDSEGELELATEEMAHAARLAYNRNDSTLLSWTFNMLGDYNGHAGNFDKSYYFFKKALNINPLDAFAAQKIISLLVNVDQNIDLAEQMLQKLRTNNQSLSLLTLEAEIANAGGNKQRKQELIQNFVNKVKDSPFRTMYRTHLFYLYNDELDQPEMAQKLAMEEINLRPTTSSYDLLMWSALKSGNLKGARAIADQHLIGASEEPIVMYHLYELYKMAGEETKAQDVKRELTLANLELGKDIMNKLFGAEAQL